MKRFIIYNILWLFAIQLFAQSYTSGEYYFDIDPGNGNGQPLSLTGNDDTSSFSLDIPTNGLTNGFHLLGIRIKHANGSWSFQERRSFYISTPFSNTADIITAEYFFDMDPGPGNATSLAIGSGEMVQFSVAIPTAFSAGFHYLGIRVKNADGAWGFFERRNFYILETAINSSKIIAAEYFFDNDPGPGMANIINLPIQADTVTSNLSFPVPCLSNGQHFLYIRVRDSLGRWGLFERDTLQINSGLASLDIQPIGIHTICENDSLILTGQQIYGMVYQWLKDGNDINGATTYRYVANQAGIYSLKMSCNASFVISNEVQLVIDNLVNYYADVDGDLFGNPNQIVQSCVPVNGYVANSNDCNDTNILEHPGQVWYRDFDNDNYSTGDTIHSCTRPINYKVLEELINQLLDCDDANSAINPGATEICNNLDDDCDGQVDENLSPILSFNVINANCHGSSDGAIDLVINGGSSPYTIAWNTGQSTEDITSIIAGNYSVSVTDASGCTAIKTGEVQQPEELMLSESHQNTLCFGSNDGSINLQLTGGTPPYQFNWSSGQNSQSISGLIAGVYTVTVSDNHACFPLNSPLEITITEPEPVSVIETIQMVSCHGGNNGSISLNPSGANEQFNFTWEGPGGFYATTQNITSLIEGAYSVSINPTNGCGGITTNYIVNQASQIVITETHEHAICPNGQNGSIDISVNGGTAPYSYLWNTGASTQDINSLIQGSYYVTITDQNNCQQVKSVSIQNNGPRAYFEFAGLVNNINYSSNLVSPLIGSPYDYFKFKIKYIDPNGQLPLPGFPRLKLDFEHNGSFIDSLDRIIVLRKEDPNDTNPIDGIIYSADIIGLEPSNNWYAIIISEEDSECDALSFEGSGPNVRDQLDIFGFANDIEFSKLNPNPNDSFEVRVTIRNESDEDALNFKVRLENQFTNEQWTQTVTQVFSKSNQTIVFSVKATNVVSFNAFAVYLDSEDNLEEFNELNNFLIRPILVGNYMLPGGIHVTSHASPNPVAVNVDAMNLMDISGFASYFNMPVNDTSVAGATVDLQIVETGMHLSGYTDKSGNFYFKFQSPIIPGVYHYVGVISDFTISAPFNGTFEVQINNSSPPVDFSVSLNFEAQQPYLSLFYNQNSGTYNLITLENSTLDAWFTVNNKGSDASSEVTALTVYVPNAIPSYLTIQVPPLASGAQFMTSHFTFAFPHYGNSLVSATADAANQYDEGTKGEENNTSLPNLFIHILKGIPELNPYAPTISDQNELPSVFECQGEFDFPFKVWNNGGAASDGFDAKLIIVDAESGDTSLTKVKHFSGMNYLSSSIAIFDNIQLNQTGKYFATVLVDIPYETLGSIIEWKENNNTWNGELTVNECKPDLELVSFKQNISPVNPNYPGEITVNWSLKNTGQLNLVDSIPLRFSITNLNDTIVVLDTIPTGIQSGETISFSSQFSNPIPGNNQLEIYVDAGNIFKELSEFNNNQNAKLCYDFIVSGSDSQRPLGIFNPGITLGNQGAYTANPVAVLFEISGPGIIGWDIIGTATAYQVSAYSHQSLICSNSYGLNQVGVYTLRVTADPENNFIECDETNNSILYYITVINQPDYFVASYHIEPSKLNPEPGESIQINVSYVNNGNNNTGDTMTVGIKLDDQHVAALPGIGLQHGDHTTVQTQNLSINTIGLHVIRAIIDKHNHVVESNEINNEASRTLLVGQYPNLKFLSITPDDSSPQLGQLLHLNFVIQNEGDTACQAQINWNYNGNNSMGTSNIYIPANETVSFTDDSAFTWIVKDPNASIRAEIFNANPQEFNSDDNFYNLGLNSLVANINTVEASCPNALDGVATIEVSGGIGNYNYSWSNAEAGSGSSYHAFAPGNYTVLITDEASPMHQTNLNFTIGFIPDLVPPSIQNAKDTILYAYNGICPVTFQYNQDFLPLVTDNCDPNPVLQISPSIGQGLAPGVYPLIFTATDAWGNQSSVTKSLTVIGTPEVYAGIDQIICIRQTNLAALELPESFPYAVGSWTLQSGVAEFNYNNIHENNLALSNLGQQVVWMQWSVENGNCPVVYDEVSIQRDIMNPEAICRNFTVYLDPNASVTVSGGTIGNDSEDNCYIDHFSIDELVYDCDDLGEHTIQLTVYDGAENSASCTAIITVLDTLGLCDFDGDGYPPGEDCDDTNASVHPNAAEICNNMDDDCDGLIDSEDPGYVDQENPIVNCPSAIIEFATIGSCEAIINYTATASDACGTASCVYTVASGSLFSVGSTTVSVTATDQYNNSASCSFTVTVIDNQNPVVICPSNIIDSTSTNSCIKIISYSATATDNCSINGSSFYPESGSSFPIGTSTVVFTASDVNTNSNSCSFTVKINPRTEVCNGKDDDCDGIVDEGFDTDADGVADCYDNCPTNSNSNQTDSDCDGIGNICDVCPGGDDTIDTNNDGKPDCKYPPLLADIIADWKCGGGQKVIVCHKAKTTICVNYSAVQTHINNGSYLGPCNNSGCGGNNLRGIDEMNKEYPFLNYLGKGQKIENDFDLFLSPNPAQNLLFIELYEPTKNGTIQILNSLGTKVYQTQIKGNTTNIQIQLEDEFISKMPGIYFLLFENDGLRLIKKFTVID